MAHAASCEQSWPAWETFKKNLVSEEGRVVDDGMNDMRTTSEGQAYSLFFSLVANDRVMFNKLLKWTETNLAQGDLTTHLPAWLWGMNEYGEWKILDENTASDADLWLAYTLGEAGRLWEDRRLVALSSLIANRILTTETINVPGLELVLLPGTNGFVLDENRVRLNPSYTPLQLMRWFTTHSKDTRWTSLLSSSKKLILESSPQGLAPDWTIYDYKRGFLPDADTGKGALGSYDAIRVYLWAGMLSPDDPDRRDLLKTLKPMARFVDSHGYPPESIHTLTGVANNPGPSGFSFAMLPLLQAHGLINAVKKQLQRVDANPVADDAYYGQVFLLYTLGWTGNLYSFDSKGNLNTRWKHSCP